MIFFDSHAHYNDPKFDNDRKDILESIYKSGITKILNAGCNLETSQKAIQMAEEYDFVYASVGISPNDVGAYGVRHMSLQEIKQLANHPKVVAIGEIGLDYYWNKENKDAQKEIFMQQIDIANEFNLPIIVHTRDSSRRCYRYSKK